MVWIQNDGPDLGPNSFQRLSAENKSLPLERKELKHISLVNFSIIFIQNHYSYKNNEGAQWLSGRVPNSRPKGRGFKPHHRYCIVVLEQDTFILA